MAKVFKQVLTEEETADLHAQIAHVDANGYRGLAVLKSNRIVFMFNDTYTSDNLLRHTFGYYSEIFPISAEFSGAVLTHEQMNTIRKGYLSNVDPGSHAYTQKNYSYDASLTHTKGLFIVLEGIDGTGKSSIVKMLKDNAPESWNLVTTREPGGTPAAESIREFLLSGGAKEWGVFAETLLFTAARRDHVENLIKPHVTNGGIVVSDRFWDSTSVYQNVKSLANLSTFNRLASPSLVPDFTFYFDMPSKDAAKRMELAGRTPDRFEGEGLDTLDKRRHAYLGLSKINPRCLVVDASQTKDTVFQTVYNCIHSLIGYKKAGVPRV